MKVKESLESLLTEFGKADLKKLELDNMKSMSCSKVEESELTWPAQKGMIIRLKRKINKCSSKEDLLTLITETMFLYGE